MLYNISKYSEFSKKIVAFVISSGVPEVTVGKLFQLEGIQLPTEGWLLFMDNN